MFQIAIKVTLARLRTRMYYLKTGIFWAGTAVRASTGVFFSNGSDMMFSVKYCHVLRKSDRRRSF